MLKSYFKSALRNLWRHKGHSLINILGLAIGMACVILILLYVKSELSYDRHHEHLDHIYLLNIQTTNPQSGETSKRAIGPYRLADELEVEFGDFENIARIAPQGRESVDVGDQTYYEEQLAFADPELLSMFTFPLIEGTATSALEDPYSVVLTEAIAQKYFGSENPMGKTVKIRENDFVITGILAPPPKLTQFPYEIIVSMRAAPQIFSRIVLENWGEGYVFTFVQTPTGSRASDYSSRLSDFTAAKLEAWKSSSPVIGMHPLKDLYLDSGELNGFYAGGDRTYVIAFSFIALFILIIACINFINLATARSSLRAKEVGLRKVVGAERRQLIGQFLTESILLAFICLVVAVVMVKLCLADFNQLADRDITFALTDDFSLIGGLIVIALAVGLLSGSYPAILLSGFDPVHVLSGKLRSKFKDGSLRKVLVTVQFATSILLLIITGMVYKQLVYVKNVDLGFDKEQLLIVGAPLSLREKYDQFQTELLSNPNVLNAAGSSRVPPGRLTSNLRARPEGVPEDQQRGMQTVWTDYDFIETMGFEMAAGRSFSRDFPADASTAFILNEAAVREIGWTNESALNKTFGSSEIRDWDSGQWENRDGKVIGVLEDFHFETLKEKIIPTVYFIAPYMAWNYVIKISGQQIPQTIRFIENTWDQFNPDIPFEYTFVDDNFADLYANEERQGRIFTIFALLAVFIGCLGLVGLASFTAERRKKEVGIRKVLGAGTGNLVVLLTKEFTLLVIIAFALAAPFGWIIVRNWLEAFAYQTPISIGVFLLAGLVTLVIAWLTVAYHTGRAALANPIRALRHE